MSRSSSFTDKSSDGKIHYHVLVDFGEVSNLQANPHICTYVNPQIGAQQRKFHATYHPIGHLQYQPRPTAFPLVDNTNPNYSRPSSS